MIKQFLFFFLLSMTFLEGKTTFKARSEIALLINADTGAVLYEKNGSLLCHPASTTKLATALYAAHLQTDWEEIIEVPSEAIGSISYEAKKRANYKKPAYWVEVGSTHVGLKKGEKLSFHNLMAATIVASANDAANVIAYHTGKGDIDLFVKGLNKYLKEELGCKKTTFYNPHGLFIPDHQTTAKDMALITRAFLKDKRLKNLGSLSTFPVDETNKQEARLLVNKNKLLRKGEHYYPKAIGLKTGYTNDARHTLVAAAEDKERCLIAVLMKCEEKDDIFKDAKDLFESAFAEEKVSQTLLKNTSKSVKKKLERSNTQLEAIPEKEVSLSYYPSEEPQLYEKVVWNSTLELPIHAGQRVAEISWRTDEGFTVLEVPLVAAADIHSNKVNVALIGGLSLLTLALIWWRISRNFR